MRILNKRIAIILFTLTIFSLISITQVKTIASLDPSTSRVSNIAVIFFVTDDPFTTKVIENLKNIENENQDKVKFTFLNPKNNIAIQDEILDAALQIKYDLFILYLPDKRESVVEDAINKIKQKNKPLILMNIIPEVALRVSKLYEKVVFVTPDSKKAGIAQGKILADLWNRNKSSLDKNGDNILQYVLLQGPSDDPQTIDRSKYVISTLNDSGIKTQELARVSANWFKDLAKSSIDNLFLKYNGRIEAIISNNDAMAIGAIEALQKYGYNKDNKSKNVAVVGIDGLQEAKDLIDKGIMTGTVIQDPRIEAEVLYNVGMNLIKNLSPTENTDYKVVDGEIIIPFPYDTYIGNINKS